MRQIDVIKIYNQKKCLVIDDFPEVRGSVKRILKNFGVNSIDTAANGDEAVALCKSHRYDIVLCDYNLGAGKDGQQVLEELRYLRALLNTSLFVLITAESSRQMVLGALECEPDDYITKPITQTSLRVRLDKALLKHEALYDIKKAIDKRDYQSAITQCDRVMKAQKKYVTDCLKLKAQLYLKIEQYPQAKKIYEDVLAIKPVHWARLGLGKTLLAMNDLERAEALLKAVLKDDNRYVEAHDLLSELYEKKKDLRHAQASTVNASKISPKSVIRHRRLAQLANRNQDNALCLQSHQNAIKHGINSCYESPQDYFNFARKVSDVVKGDHSRENQDLVKQAFKTIERVKKRFHNASVSMQAKLVESQIHAGQDNLTKAREAIEEAKKIGEDAGKLTPEARLEEGRALLAVKKDAEAEAIFRHLAKEYAGDRELMAALDSLSAEPLSGEGKTRAGELTKKGIMLYDDKQFDAAIEVFAEALNLFPKHVGLNLNLIQVVLAAAKDSGQLTHYEPYYRRCLEHVKQITRKHPQYERCEYLRKQLEKRVYEQRPADT